MENKIKQEIETLLKHYTGFLENPDYVKAFISELNFRLTLLAGKETKGNVSK